jgi:hypothetical protein
MTTSGARGSANGARGSRCDRHARLRLEHRRHRLEQRYRRLLALYPKDHRHEHAEEMVSVLLAAAHHAELRTQKPAARARRFGQHAADSADLIAGALRIRSRMALDRIRRSRWFSATVRDPRWSDALAVVSVVAPLLLLVAALAEFDIPQAAASGDAGHPNWPLGSVFYVWDLPLTAGAPAVAILAFVRLRLIAGIVALATGISQLVVGAAPAFSGNASPAIACAVLLAGTAAAALLLSPRPAQGLKLLKWWGIALVGAIALVLGGFSVGTNGWFGSAPLPAPGFGRTALPAAADAGVRHCRRYQARPAAGHRASKAAKRRDFVRWTARCGERLKPPDVVVAAAAAAAGAATTTTPAVRSDGTSAVRGDGEGVTSGQRGRRGEGGTRG